MPGRFARPTLAALLFALAYGVPSSAQDETDHSGPEVVISVADQRMIVLRDGMWVQKFKISTSKFGLGDSFGSYRTPLGKHRICDKIGEGLPVGSVIKRRNATGEILPVNAPGRDPIVTRILWLEGLEQRNANAKSRGIYIHGTVEEDKLGSAVSYGCIRMRSRDVIDAFEGLPIGTIVTIQQEKLPHYKRWSAPPTLILASRNQPKVKVVAEKEKEKPEDSGKPELRLVSRKTGTSEKPETKVAPASSALARTERVTAAKTEPAATPEPHAASEPRVTMGGTAALTALKGSILFSGIPGHGPNTEGLTSSSTAKPTAADQEAESAAAGGELPRVTFRAPVGERIFR